MSTLEQICAAFRATLVPGSREQAEQLLDTASHSPGFAQVLLQVTASNSVEEHIRQAAAIYFKNKLIREKWQHGLVEPDKAFVRANILEAMNQAPQDRILSQLSMTVDIVCEKDFPQTWTDLPAMIEQQLSRNDATAAYTGLLALRSILKKYRMKPNTEHQTIQPLIGSVFPFVSQMLEQCDQMDDTRMKGKFKWLIVKIFNTANWNYMSPHLMSEQAVGTWMNAFGQILQPVAENATHADGDSFPMNKAQKHVLKGLARIVNNYGSPKNSPYKNDGGEQYGTFFMKNVAPKFVELTLQLLNLRCTATLTPRVTQNCFVLLDECVTSASTYKAMRPHMSGLLNDCLFPVLCFSPEDYELWQHDPHELIRKSTSCEEDMVSPQMAAVNLLIQLSKYRAGKSEKAKSKSGGDSMLDGFMQFLVGVMSAFQANPTLQNAFRCEGAVYAVGCIDEKVKKTEEYAPALETLALQYVLPVMNCQFGFLRARACWFCIKYADFPFNNTGIRQEMLKGVVQCLHDTELPVRAMSAFTIRALLWDPDNIEDLRPLLPRLLEAFLKLMKDIDHDELVASLQMLVRSYEDQISPYAVALVREIGTVFMRLVEADDEDLESSMAANECLKTMNTILIAVAQHGDIYDQLLPVLLPVVAKSMQENRLDLFEDAMETATLITYIAPNFPMEVWQMLAHMHHCFDNYATSYIEHMVGVLDNFMTRFPEQYVNPPTGNNHLDMLRRMLTHIWSRPEVDENDVRAACEILQCLLLNCKGKVNVDGCLVGMLRPFMARFDTTKSNITKAECVAVIGSLFWYNPVLALNILESNQWTADVLKVWFEMMPHLRRPKDKKLTVLALSTLLSFDAANLPPSVTSQLPATVEHSCNLCLQLNSCENQESNGIDDSAYAHAPEKEVEELGSDEDFDDDDSIAYLELLKQKIKENQPADDADFVDDEDEWDDFCLSAGETSPIDDVDALVVFRQALEASPIARNLIDAQSPATQASVQRVFEFAVQRAEKAQQEALLKSA